MSGNTTAVERLLEVSNKLWDAMYESGEVPTYAERSYYYLALKDAMDENAKLRELVDGLRYCANESHGHGRCSVRFVDGYVTHCPLYDVDSGTAKCEALMHELVIEVEE